MDELEAAWAELHDATPSGWYVVRPKPPDAGCCPVRRRV